MIRLKLWFLATAFASLLFFALPTSNVIAQSDGDRVEEKIREQTIYVPYDELYAVFEKQGRGVFLPYEKFQALWEAARNRGESAKSAPLPVDALISEADSVAAIDGDAVRVTSKLTIELLKSGWNSVPLRLQHAALLSTKLDGKPALVIADTEGGYRMLVESKGGAAKDEANKQLILEIEYAAAIDKSPGRNQVTFAAPLAPVNRWRFTVAQLGVKVNIFPALATSQPPSEEGNEKSKDETVVVAFVGAAPQVRIEWTPKAEGATGMATLATVLSQQEVFIEEGVVRTRANLRYDISRAELSQLQIEVAGDQKITSVFDANVRKWEFEQTGDTQRINVDLFEPVIGIQNITLELERFVEDFTSKPLKPTIVKALDVSRQQGVVVIRVGPSLLGEVIDRTGLAQLDLSELPESLRSTGWTFAYRFAALPYELSLELERVTPRLTAEYLVEAYIEPRQLSLDVLTIYNIERSGVFQLDLAIPPGFEIRSVRGQVANNVEAAVVDQFQQIGSESPKLVVNLARKAIGKIGLLVSMERKLQDNNLLQPTGESTTLPIPIVRPQQEYLATTIGRVIVYAPESLRMSASQTDGFRSIPFTEAAAATGCRHGNRFPSLRETLAFSFAADAKELLLAVERRKPQVTVRQLLTARLDAGVIKFDATFFYEIRYSGVDNLRIDVPESVSTEVRNQSPTLREIIGKPAADGGPVSIVFSGDTELLGDQQVRLTWEQKLSEFEIGKLISLAIPQLKPLDVDRAWGQIVVAKAETIDVQPDENEVGLRPIDPRRDLMPGATVVDAARAFEFHDDWSLSLNATRYRAEEIKRTSIDRAVARMVATRSNQIGVQALYRVQSARQRLAIRLPEGAEFDAQPLRINGQVVTLERGGKDELFVPLTNRDAATPFVLELRYTIPGNWSRLDLPVFLDDPAVQKVYVCAFLPGELTMLGSRGPWTLESHWMPSELSWKPISRQSDIELAAWVSEGIAQTESPTFQTDGSLYAYSTLRPESPPDGSLKLTAIPTKGLAAIVFAVVLVIGLLMFDRPLTQKLIVVGILAITLISSGIFAPTFARQLISLPLFAAAAIVGILWVVWLMLRVLPKQWTAMKSEFTAQLAVDAGPATTPKVEEPMDDNE